MSIILGNVPSYVEQSFHLFQKALYFINQREEFLRVALFQGKATKHLPSFSKGFVHEMWDRAARPVTIAVLKQSASANLRHSQIAATQVETRVF